MGVRWVPCVKKSGRNPISLEFWQMSAIKDQLGIRALMGTGEW